MILILKKEEGLILVSCPHGARIPCRVCRRVDQSNILCVRCVLTHGHSVTPPDSVVWRLVGVQPNNVKYNRTFAGTS